MDHFYLKKKLTPPEMIEHLKNKGVLFNICSEQEALTYLQENNNYFKLTAYRKNYPKNKEGKYVNLEFAYLKDLAIIDMRIRKCLLDMCLDVEHDTRIRIIQAIEKDPSADGYRIVQDFIHDEKINIQDMLVTLSGSPYCKDIIAKYGKNLPVWAFVEILQFKDLTRLFLYVSKCYSDKNMIKQFYMLQEIRKLRNACAHSNCIINDLKSQSTSSYRPQHELILALNKIPINQKLRQRKLSNDRIRQITTLLYYYSQYIRSHGLYRYHCKQLHETFVRRPSEHPDYYQNTEQIRSFFDYILKLLDKWYQNGI